MNREPVLAAMSTDDPCRLALLERVPLPRRISAWRDHAEHPNAGVGLQRALALAPAVPTVEVATELVARALTANDTTGLRETLDALGSAGDAARQALGALARHLA